MYTATEDIASVATFSFWFMLFLKSILWSLVGFSSSCYHEYVVFNCICAQGNAISVIIIFIFYANSTNLPAWLSLLFFLVTIFDAFPIVIYIAKLFDDYSRPFLFIFSLTNTLTSIGSLLLYCHILDEAQKNMENDTNKYEIFYRLTSIHLSIKIVHYMLAFVYSILSDNSPSWMSQWRNFRN